MSGSTPSFTLTPPGGSTSTDAALRAAALKINQDGSTPAYASSSSSAAARSNPSRPQHRKRSSSLLKVEKIEQSPDQLLDQSAGFNANADWVNYKGAWVIHVVLIALGKILLDVIPGMRQDISWTVVNLGYIAVTYLMFHYVTGAPFDSNAGAYDELTLWEQIEDGAQNTPTKKALVCLPIGLFLVSTHYSRFSLVLFSLNFFALAFAVIPKLPALHRMRLRVMLGNTPDPSGPPTPIHSRPTSAASFK